MEEKTRISDLTEGFEFLDHRVRLKWHRQFGLMPRIEIPKHKRTDLRYGVKQVTKGATISRSFVSPAARRLAQLLPLLPERVSSLLRSTFNLRPSVALAQEHGSLQRKG